MTIILGGGYIGQLLKTAIPTARVFDWRPEAPTEPPRSLGPQYLWRPLPGIEQHEAFNVRTTVDGRPATERSILAYKEKVGKQLDAADWRAQFKHFMPGYHAVLPIVEVEYGKRVEKIRLFEHELVMADGSVQPYDTLLSAIPLSALLPMSDYQIEDFTLVSKPIYVTIETTSHFVRSLKRGWMWVDYDGDPKSPIYRRTYMPSGQIHSESLHPTSGARRIVPGKIFANDKVPFVLDGLKVFDVFTFGRFASWAPEELAHETYDRILAFAGGAR